MTQPLDWTKIFDAAFRFPEHRVANWKRFRKAAPDQIHGYCQTFRAIAKVGKTFHLSNDLVWAITKLSIEIDPLILMEHARAARFPFSVTILEWDVNVRSHSYQQMGAPVQVPEDATGEHPSMVIVSTGRALKTISDFSYDSKKRELFQFPLIYDFDPEREGSSADAPIATRYKNDLQQFVAIRMGDYMTKPEEMSQRPDFSRKAHWWLTTAVINRFEESARVIEQDPTLGCYMNGPISVEALALVKKGFPDKAHKILVTATAGNPRWFGALCFLLNQQKVVRYVQAQQSPEPVGTKPREVDPQVATVLTLFLPREKVVTNLVRLAQQGPRKAVGEHDVSGFWSIGHKRGRPDCLHQWPVEHTRRQVCSGCGALRWWKTDHKRGHGPVVKARRRIMDYGGQDIARLESLIPKEHPDGS